MQLIVAAGVMLLAVLGLTLWGLPRAASAYAASKQGPDAKIIASFEALQRRFDQLLSQVQNDKDELAQLTKRAENAAQRSAYHAGRVMEERDGGHEGEESAGGARTDEAGSNGKGMPAVHQVLGEDPDIAALRRQIAFM